jgi:hypothetical protein
VDCGDYLSEERATDCDFGELERDLARMAHDTRPDLDQASLNAALLSDQSALSSGRSSGLHETNSP